MAEFTALYGTNVRFPNVLNATLKKGSNKIRHTSKFLKQNNNTGAPNLRAAFRQPTSNNNSITFVNMLILISIIQIKYKRRE
jgi:hypothetical protein